MNRVAIVTLLILLFPFVGGADDRAELPEEVDLRDAYRHWELIPGSQGTRNTCSLFAITSLAELEWTRVHGTACPFSPEFLTWAANEATGRSGDQAMFYEAVIGLNAFGIAAEELMPYERREARTRVPSDNAASDASEASGRWRVHWIKRWDVEQQLTDLQLEQIRRALAAGHPVACGLRWPSGKVGSALIEVPSSEDVFDGHSIAFVGYRDDPDVEGEGVLIFRNSYGPGWGDEGYGTMSYAYAQEYANDALWIELGPPGCEVPIERLEAESMEVIEKHHCEASPQSMRSYGGAMWSGRRQLFSRCDQMGWIEISFDVRESGRYLVRLLATAAPDYGRVSVTLDDQIIQETFDLYSGRVCPTGSLELGEFTLDAGEHRLRIESFDKSDASAGFSFGIDTLDLLPPE